MDDMGLQKAVVEGDVQEDVGEGDVQEAAVYLANEDEDDSDGE